MSPDAPVQLLTAKRIKTLVGVDSPEAAERLMDSWGVPFIHLGVGRGLGRRWAAPDVAKALAARRRDPVYAPPKKKSKTTEADKFFSMSAKEAYALTFGRP